MAIAIASTPDGAARAASLDWLGGWNGDFQSPGGGSVASGDANWSNGGVAGAGDAVTVSAAHSSTTNAAPGPNNNALPVVYGTAGSWGSLAGDGTVWIADSAVFTLGALGQTTTFSGTIADATGVTSPGTIQLISGGGTTTDFTLSGNNTFSGTFAVDGAILRLASTGTLGGNLLLTSGSGGIASQAFIAGTVMGNVTNAGLLTSTGIIGGTVTNTNTFNASGSIGGLVNTSGTTTVTGDLSAGSISNAGTLLVSGGNLTTASALTNNGTLIIASGRTLTATTITNASGAVWTGDFQTNTGTLSNFGTWNGAIANTATGTATNGTGGTVSGRVTNAGVMTNSGQLAGGLTNTGRFTATGGSILGTVINSGSFTFSAAATTFNDSFANNSGGTVVLASGAAPTGITSFDNAGTLTFSTAGLTFGASSINNLAGGLIDVSAFGGTLAGNVSNAGTISLQNGSTTYSTLAINGNYTGANGTIALDIDRTAGASVATRSDLVAISGTVSGSTVLSFKDVGSVGYFTNPITVVTTGGGTGTFTAAHLTSTGLIDYTLAKSGTSWVVQSSVSSSGAAAAPASIAAAVTVASTGFAEPVSNVVERTNLDANGVGIANGAGLKTVGRHDDDVSIGLWTRTKGGRFGIDSTNTVGSNSDTAHSNSNFIGVQVGADARFTNIAGSAWTGHLGLTAGDLQISSRGTASGASQSADIDAPFFGIYGVLAHNGFFFDTQLQRDYYNVKLNTISSTGQAQLVNQNVDSRGYSFQGSVGQVVGLGSNWFVEPTLGINYTTVQIDPMEVGIVNVRSDDLTSTLGTTKVKVGTWFAATSDLILKPSVEAGFWHEFAGNATAVATVQGSSMQVSSSRPSNYGQVGLALDIASLATNVTGFVRGDATFGNDISGIAATVGVRYSF